MHVIGNMEIVCELLAWNNEQDVKTAFLYADLMLQSRVESEENSDSELSFHCDIAMQNILPGISLKCRNFL